VTVRFGLSVPNRGVVIGAGNPKDLVAMCEAADASELFDAVFTGDNLISKPRLDAIVFLSLVAGRTRRVTLGTACMASFVFRHPIVLANQWAALDLLSDGRTLLGVHRRRAGQLPRPALAERGEVGDGVRRHGRAGRARRAHGRGDGDSPRPLDR
jgi:alkanesulfonate monooxygenase SsuD/methylene tetrahydromethanopterin reductase-like flavin-dependent oxidoreductase (luciferase family)